MSHSKSNICFLALVVLSVGCGEKPPRSSKAPSPGTSEVTDSVAPEDVTEIRLEQLSGGPPLPGVNDKKLKEIVLVRKPESAQYFNRIAKAMIDNGFLKLKDGYRGTAVDVPVLTITLSYGDNKGKIVHNSDSDIETNPTFVFECLIDYGDKYINAPPRKQE